MVRLESDADLTPLFEAMEQGRDGCPRWIAVNAPRPRLASTAESIVAEATARGFVALPVDSYLRRQIIGAGALDERTLLLLDEGASPGRAHAALLDASAQSPRPHLLLTLGASRGAIRDGIVREARAAYRRAPEERESPQAAQLLVRASRAEEFVADGRHAAAERLLRDVAGALSRRGEHVRAARLMIRLGRLLKDRGRSKGAFEAFQEAATLAGSGGGECEVVEARVWQAATRVADAAFVEAEALCRAALEAPRGSAWLTAWTQGVLCEALLWQGRITDAPEPDLDALGAAEPAVAAVVHEIAVRRCVADGRLFEAGRRVERLKALAAATKDRAAAVSAHLVDLEVLAAIGDLGRARDAFGAAVAAARVAKEPFRVAWARLVWLDALRRAGHDDAARSHLDKLRRVGRIAPLLLRREIARRAAGGGTVAGPSVSFETRRQSSLAVALLQLAHEDDDDREAIRRLIERVANELHTSRLELVSTAAGPPTVICRTGEGLPTRLGIRVLEVAFPVGPERQAGGLELGLPVRFGTRVVGAIVARWPLDRCIPGDAAELLELAGVIAAPRIDTMLAAKWAEARASASVPELLGVSEAIANVRKAIVRAAAAPFAVLIEGESGVGKELVARAVHHLSPRRERTFCDVNCAALPEELLESELFGHARGAFSGAVVDRPGLFEEADGGTLMLDEVADLSSRAQAKLLRAIQQQEVRRVGESFTRKVDVRIVAAANRDMRAEASAGRFRHDLLYRLDVVRICIPPLRERPDDIPILAEQCWSAATARTGSRARLSPATLSELARYAWPGNVRELQNVIASLAVTASPRGWVRPTLLPAIIGAASTVTSARLADAREQFERRFVEVALAQAGGNRARTAQSLGLSRQGLLKTLVRLRLDQTSVSASESC